MRALFRRLTPTIAAIALLASCLVVGQNQVATSAAADIADGYSFDEMPIDMPPGYELLPTTTVREVNPAYTNIRSWISSVGASVAINDLNGSGVSNGLCLVDTRTDSVVVTYAPTAQTQDRFTPFTLVPGNETIDSTMAPMGCAPGDFNSDGLMDLLVYYWGRTPIQFIRTGEPRGTLSPSSYTSSEVVPSATNSGQYTGEQWNTNAVTVADFDGDGHPDLIFGNYFPNSGVLDPSGHTDVVMNDSMSNAKNGAGERVYRWSGTDDRGFPIYHEEKGAIPPTNSSGWTLALGAGDFTDDLLPEVYVANDFGHDHLLYNVSTPGSIKFTAATSARSLTTPKSFTVGNDSFKGMGVDFVDIYSRGRFDMIVSNITTAWGLQESNYVWRNNATSAADMDEQLASGTAPFTQQAQELGLAWSGWGWDIKAADLRNSGNLEVLQTTGFVKGDPNRNRWAWLQELATSNDVLLQNPAMWPHLTPGDDLAGQQSLAVYTTVGADKFVNISHEIGTDTPIPTRGIALADTTGSGNLDFAVARQWGPPAFYANTSRLQGHALVLDLYRPAEQGLGSPAYNATATIHTNDGRTMVNQLDGGSGHGGKRSFQLHFGLGTSPDPVRVDLAWRDSAGTLQRQSTQLAPGTHRLSLTDSAEETS